MKKGKYELVTLVVSGDAMLWKALNHCDNIFSTPEQIYLGGEGSHRFIITWMAQTFIGMSDEAVASKIMQASKQVEKIVGEKDRNMALTFRVVNALGSPDIIDSIVYGKFERIQKELGTYVEEGRA